MYKKTVESTRITFTNDTCDGKVIENWGKDKSWMKRLLILAPYGMRLKYKAQLVGPLCFKVALISPHSTPVLSDTCKQEMNYVFLQRPNTFLAMWISNMFII